MLMLKEIAFYNINVPNQSVYGTVCVMNEYILTTNDCCWLVYGVEDGVASFVLWVLTAMLGGHAYIV